MAKLETRREPVIRYVGGTVNARARDIPSLDEVNVLSSRAALLAGLRWRG
jgi:hypothetical protein